MRNHFLRDTKQRQGRHAPAQLKRLQRCIFQRAIANLRPKVKQDHLDRPDLGLHRRNAFLQRSLINSVQEVTRRVTALCLNLCDEFLQALFVTAPAQHRVIALCSKLLTNSTANTGTGPDLIWSLYSVPHLFPQKCIDVSDVADYLGKKYGGWVPLAEAYGKAGGKWISIPVAVNGGYINYRVSQVKAAGFNEVPQDTKGFLELCKALKAKGTPSGFPLGRATGDGNAFAHWLLWSHGAAQVDEQERILLVQEKFGPASRRGNDFWKMPTGALNLTSSTLNTEPRLFGNVDRGVLGCWGLGLESEGSEAHTQGWWTTGKRERRRL